MKKPVIYALCEPNGGEIRYVGQTVNIKKRLNAHYGKELNSHLYKSRWLRTLVAQGQKADVIILHEADKPEELDQLEIIFIGSIIRILGCRFNEW